MTRTAALVLTTTALLYSAATAGEPLSPIARDAPAGRQQAVFTVDAANSKYTQQHVIDVGDSRRARYTSPATDSPQWIVRFAWSLLTDMLLRQIILYRAVSITLSCGRSAHGWT
jgi:hypothetical protein